jgi:hypothetical protein
MRIAYVGLSGPLFYDYGHLATPGPADMQSSPNPILDSPYGLLLLFDELWFLTRSVCPENMRKLDYVRFLDETGDLPDLSSIDVSDKVKEMSGDTHSIACWNRVRSLFTRYDRILATMGIDWGPSPDNHSHELQIGTMKTHANAVSLESLLTDLDIVKHLGPNVEMVANSFGQRWLDTNHPTLSEADLAHVLVIERIPNYLSPEGPYHPVIEEARANPYLRHFRGWISSTSGSRELDDIAQVKEEVEAAICDTERQLLLKYLDEQRRFLSVGKTLAGAVSDLILPFSGTVTTLLSDLRDARQARDLRWQGFLVGLESPQ